MKKGDKLFILLYIAIHWKKHPKWI